MKTSRLFATLMMAVVCIGLSSCSKEERTTVIEGDLIGKWELTLMKSWDLNGDGKQADIDEVVSGTFMVFKQDRTGYTYEAAEDDEGNTYEESYADFEWKLEGNILKIDNIEEDLHNVVKILLLNSTTMKFEVLGDDAENLATLTYTKRNLIGNEEEQGQVLESNLIGKWELTLRKGWMLNDNGIKEYFNEADNGSFIVFEQNGIGYHYENIADYEGSRSYFQWELEGNILKTNDTEDDSYGENKILLLNSTTMEFEISRNTEGVFVIAYTKI
jgi:hypothetical protein